jgi:hypothetical protein
MSSVTPAPATGTGTVAVAATTAAAANAATAQSVLDQVAARLQAGDSAALTTELLAAADGVVAAAVAAYMRQTDKLADLQEITNVNAYLSGAQQQQLTALQASADAANNALYVGVRNTQATDRDADAAMERADCLQAAALVTAVAFALWQVPYLRLAAPALVVVFVVYELLRLMQDRTRRPYDWNQFYFPAPAGAAGASCYD